MAICELSQKGKHLFRHIKTNFSFFHLNIHVFKYLVTKLVKMLSKYEWEYNWLSATLRECTMRDLLFSKLSLCPYYRRYMAIWCIKLNDNCSMFYLIWSWLTIMYMDQTYTCGVIWDLSKSGLFQVHDHA